MADSLPLDTATLAGLFASSILYGMVVVLFVGCLYVLLHKPRSVQQPNYILISSATTMFLLTTVILALSFSRIEDALLLSRDTPGGPVSDLEQISQWKELARTLLTLVITVVGDMTLIYRCWVVWGRNYLVIVLPVVLLVGLIIVDTFVGYVEANLGDGSTMFVDRVKHWITAALSMTLVQNSLVTGLIVFKVWRTDAQIAEARVNTSRSRSLRPVIATILESGMLYVATLFIFLMVYVANSNAQYIMVDMLNPMICITFYVLIVRVGLRRHSPPTVIGMGTMANSHPTQPIPIAVHGSWQTELPTTSTLEPETTREDDTKAPRLNHSENTEQPV